MTNRTGQVWYCQYIRQGHFLVIGSNDVSNSNGIISNSYRICHDVFFLIDNEVFALYERHDGSWEKYDYNQRII